MNANIEILPHSAKHLSIPEPAGVKFRQHYHSTETTIPVNHHDVIIIGAGASGLMCAITAGQRGRRVLILEHAAKVGGKILISGGGRCNFTNLNVEAENYLSANPHFCKSALKRFTQRDFIALVEKHSIAYHERDHGQLFCDNSARDILDMLLSECREAAVTVKTGCEVTAITHQEQFLLQAGGDEYSADSLVVACGGLSIPTMGASDLAFRWRGSLAVSCCRRGRGWCRLCSVTVIRRSLSAFRGFPWRRLLPVVLTPLLKISSLPTAV